MKLIQVEVFKNKILWIKINSPVPKKMVFQNLYNIKEVLKMKMIINLDNLLLIGHKVSKRQRILDQELKRI